MSRVNVSHFRSNILDIFPNIRVLNMSKTGFVLASVPFHPMAWHWDFYSQTGICIPLPITRQSFAGHQYSFGVIIVLNFVLFLIIAAVDIFLDKLLTAEK
nr:hypothetical protein BaRGS_019073 [Batillaria attramentaria]